MAIIVSCIPAMVFAEDTDDADQEVTEEVQETEETSVPDAEPVEEETEPEAAGEPEQVVEETEEIVDPVEDNTYLSNEPGPSGAVFYVDSYFDGVSREVYVHYTYCYEYINLSSVSDTEGVTLSNGKWYVVDTNLTYSNRIEISGEVNIILVNGKTLTCSNGIHVGENATLNIYGQSTTRGILHTEVDISDDSPLGGDAYEKAGVINIHSGRVEAIAYSSKSAAIGGGKGYYNNDDTGCAKSINIYAGEISAINNNYGAGIGGGCYGYTCWGDGINIYGGDIEVQGHNGAGIGAGPEAKGNKGTINIYGGNIDALGWASSAGIGGGKESSNGNINIYGGVIKAIAKGSMCTGAGIGSGAEAPQKGEIHIYNGIIYAVSLQGAGIGAGCSASCDGSVTIEGGIICASSVKGGAGIGGGSEGNGAVVTISGGAVQAVSNDYDGKEESSYDEWMDHAMNAYSMQNDPGNDFAYLCIEMFSYIEDCCRDSDICGAGIGGGYLGNGNRVEISGKAFVSARSSLLQDSCAIGRGSGDIDDPNDGSLVIGDELCVMHVFGLIEETALYDDRVDTCREGSVVVRPCTNIERCKYVRCDDDTHNCVCSYCGEVFENEAHTLDNDGQCIKCGKSSQTVAVWYYMKDLQGETVVLHDEDHFLGEEYIIEGCTASPQGKTFCGWRMINVDDVDDPGVMYYPGETVNLVNSTNVFTFEAVYCSHEDSVYYIDGNGRRQSTLAMVIDEDVRGLSEGWYVTVSDIDISGYCIRGNVKIILADGTQINMGDTGKIVSNDPMSKLTIYGQENNTGSLICGSYTGNGYEQYGGTTSYGTLTCQSVVRINGGEITCGSLTSSGYLQYGGTVQLDTFSSSNITRIKKGSFTCGSLTVDNAGLYLEGGNTEITSLNYSNFLPVYLGWNSADDSISFGEIDPGYSMVVANGKFLTDSGRTVVLSDTITGADVADKTLIPYDGCGAILAGHRITLEGDIGVWFYMEIVPEVLEHQYAYARITIPRGNSTESVDIPLSEAIREDIGSKTYYKFKCNVSAKDMTSKIKIQIFDGDKRGFEYSYSVLDYARHLLAHTGDNEQYAKAAPLVRAMLNYGAYAQVLFGINTDNLANQDEGIAYTTDELAEGYVSQNPGCDMTALPDDVHFIGATLSLKSETTLSLYFQSDETLTFSCEGMIVERDVSGGYQIARIRGIKASQIGDTRYLKVTVGGDEYTVSYNPLTYCFLIMHSGSYSEELKNVCMALDLYYKVAVKYSDNGGD